MLRRQRKKMTMRLDRPKTLGEKAIGALTLMWKAMLLVGLLVGFYYAERALLFFLYESPFFAVKSVKVYDLPDKVAENFLAMPTVEQLKGQNLFLLSSKGLAQTLENIPSLKNVRVKKRFPETLEIHAMERLPVVAVAAVSFYLYDLDGVCVGRVAAGSMPPAHLPIISGVKSSQVRIGKTYNGHVVNDGIDLMRSLRDANFRGLDQISEYHWDDGEGWIVIFQNGAEVKLGRHDMAAALAKMHYLFQYLKGFDQLMTADLRFKQQIPFQLKTPS